MKTLRNLLACVVLACAGTELRADQLQYLDPEHSQAALEVLKKQPFVVTYCSKCDDARAVLWQVSHVEDRPTDSLRPYWEITLVARPVLKSKAPLKPNQQADFEYVGNPTQSLEQVPLDLAYTYVLVGHEWICLGRLLHLPCEVSVDRLRI